MPIHIEGSHFKDESGRTVMLRGVNMGGSSKVPFRPNGATHLQEGFFDHRSVSFVGRPFPLAEADEHFGRLRDWGLTFLRFLVTWEAIEHAGPGIYDQEYLDYLYAMIEKSLLQVGSAVGAERHLAAAAQVDPAQHHRPARFVLEIRAFDVDGHGVILPDIPAGVPPAGSGER